MLRRAGKTSQPTWLAGAVVAVPIAIYLAALWLGAIATPLPVLVIGLAIVGLIVASRGLTRHVVGPRHAA